MTGNLGVDLLFQFCKCCTIPILVDCSPTIEEVYKEYSFTTPKYGEPDLAYSSCCLEFLHCWACHTLPLHWCLLWFWNVMVNPKSITCNTPIQEYCALCRICQYCETAILLTIYDTETCHGCQRWCHMRFPDLWSSCTFKWQPALITTKTLCIHFYVWHC